MSFWYIVYLTIFLMFHIYITVFPNITVEMTSDRRVYVTTRDSPRQEVILPYFGHEVYCVMTKPDTVECKSMEYQVVLKTGTNNRVRRWVTVRKLNLDCTVRGLLIRASSS